jgi:S1-C subfamily serine protease
LIAQARALVEFKKSVDLYIGYYRKHNIVRFYLLSSKGVKMFVKALRKVNKFTYPVIISKKYSTGKVESGCASFIILNKDGWVLTAAHVIADFLNYEQEKKKQVENNTLIANIQNDVNLNEKQKKRQINQIPKNPNAIANISYWWGQNGVTHHEMSWDNFLDLAIVRLEGLALLPDEDYPVFYNLSDQDDLPVGQSLCRVGFPFYEIKSTFDDEKNSFTLAPGTLPIPRFPNDGILTRGMRVVDEPTGKTALFIETSTPGLRGQSGGPIFDIEGRIWGVQSQTMHLPLGFSPKIKEGMREITEHQFLNVGMGVHAHEVIKFLQDNNVEINISDADQE